MALCKTLKTKEKILKILKVSLKQEYVSKKSVLGGQEGAEDE